MANRTATRTRTHREEDLSHTERIRHADEEMRRALRMIKAVADEAVRRSEIPREAQLDERDHVIAEEVRQNQFLLLMVGDVIEKRLTSPAVA